MWISEGELCKLEDKGATIGKCVKIDSSAVIINPELLTIGDHSQIDAFCFISGKVSIGRFTEIGVHVIISGGPGVHIGDCCAISPYGYLFTNSADFQNQSLSLPTVPKDFKRKTDKGEIFIKNHVIIGARSTIFPRSRIAEGCKFGVDSVIKGLYMPWCLYVSNGNRVAQRKKKLPKDIIINDYHKLLDSFSLHP